MEITIIAGEASGDAYGAELARALRDLHPDVEVRGMGGPGMRRAGVALFRDTGAWGAIGIVNALKVVPAAFSAYASLRRLLRAHPPSVLVLIDFGAFNVRAGRYARRLGIPVYYFIAPGSWRKTGSVDPKLLEAADLFCTQLPWHVERLRAAGAAAEFFGHPLLDLVRASAPAADLRREWDLAEGLPVLCLLPGSRRHEVEHMLPAFLAAGALMRERVPDLRFVLGLAEVVSRDQAARILSRHGWRIRTAPRELPWPQAMRAEEKITRRGESRNFHSPPEVLVATGRTYDCLAVSQAALCASGTVTLEAAVLGVPQVIAYRGSLGMRLQYRLVKSKIKYVGLPNLLLDAPVCPELLDAAATPEGIAAAGIPLLEGGPSARAQKDAARRLMEVLGQPGAIRRAAGRILELGAVSRG